jgi:hypothetical protein
MTNPLPSFLPATPAELVPDLRNLRNEVVFVLTLVASILAELIVIFGEADVASTASLAAMIPLLAGLVARTQVYGPDIKARLEP